ncbi:DUF5316 family protein [Alkalihalobacterium bogoriense]|uniref:DUF5316 family protein n=1 Tax=Alkalihalobacterium bogoriense TaxID=246272 RepID=UPI000478F2FC|nr:DUF5316 family protein [Alkalihalobacterium bogoriense]
MVKLLLIVGVVGIINSDIFIGAWTDGQQQRANFYSKTEDNSNFEMKIALISGLVGLVCLGIAAGLIYYF